MSGVRVRVTKDVLVPNGLKVARIQRAPELGPRILFFSGGSALKKLSRTLKQYTYNSIHLITPFDSGGSSAKLREAFGMLAVGDLRNRLMALADESALGNPEIYELFSYRFPDDGDVLDLGRQLHRMCKGTHPLVAAVQPPMRQLIITPLSFFAQKMPPGFDLRKASIGNLILAGGYLQHDRDINSVIYLFSKLVAVRGLVRPIVDADLHLAAELDNGTRVVGQHLLTGKEVAPLEEPVRDLGLVRSLDGDEPAEVDLEREVAHLIRDADLICYPMGSFYSSLLANLLPKGVGRAIAAAHCPKVYVPNTGLDPEQQGMDMAEAVRRIIEVVRRDAGATTPVSDILNLVLVDLESGAYAGELTAEEVARVEDLGVSVVDLSLVSAHKPPNHDPVALTEALISLA